jgi:hypothetical protein
MIVRSIANPDHAYPTTGRSKGIPINVDALPRMAIGLGDLLTQAGNVGSED